MAYKLIDGKKLAEKILKSIKKQIKSRRLKLRLAVVLVGENSVSRVFIRKKKETCEKVGIDFKLYQFEKNIILQGLKNAVEKIAEEKDNSGVVIQLPLPGNFNGQEILNLIPPEKDIDCLSRGNLDNFYGGKSLILPPVVGAVSHLLREYKILVKRKNIVVIGAGRLVGQPVSKWLLSKKARVLVVDKFTKNISSLTKKADIIISGVGKPGLITGDMVKSGVVIIDAGTIVEGNKLKGDIDFKSVSKRASYITPVPGGVGPMTIACLLENLIVNKKK